MTVPPHQIASSTTRLGQLQRGRGDGYLAALAAGRAAHDDLLACICSDPRVDTQVEARDRYDGELLVALDLPLAPVLEHVREATERVLGHDVLAAAWALGHAPVRAWLAREDADSLAADGVVECLLSRDWARVQELPAWAHEVWRRMEQERPGDLGRVPRPMPVSECSLAELLELARTPRSAPFATLVRELCARGHEATRVELAAIVQDRSAIGNAKHIAAAVLGELGDERLLPFAEALFAREDVFEDPERRLPNDLRTQRAALSAYAQRLPGSIALPLARAWHGRGGYSQYVAGRWLARHATAADRAWLEAFVAARWAEDGSTEVAGELEALARIADPASIPLLVEVARSAWYSLARLRCVRGLGRMAAHPAAEAVLREALWDCEDEACEVALDALPALDMAATQRVGSLASSPLVDPELATRARLRRSPR